MRRILVTGGAGFLGSHLCERLLQRGHYVIAVDNFFTGSRRNLAHLRGRDLRHQFEVVRHDIVDRFYAEVDEVYHLACPASPVHYQRNPVRTLQTAAIGTMNVLELATQARARVVIASTSEIYGDPLVHPQVETYWGNVNPVGKRACYDEGKRCAEALAVAYRDQHGLDVRVARIFNTYGPRMHEADGRVVSNFIVQALRGEPVTIYGRGDQTRSLCYQSDLIDGLVALMAADGDPGPVNLGNPEELTVCELAELILELTGSSSAIVHRDLPADDPVRRRPDITRAQEALGWHPSVPVRKGLRATVGWFRKHLAGARPNGAARDGGVSTATARP